MASYRKYIVMGLLLVVCSTIQAQEQKRKPWVLRALKAVKTYIDSSAVKGIDTRYLEVPEKPWAVTVKYNMNDMNMKSTTKMSEERLMEEYGIDGELNFESKFQPRKEVSIGAWIGYRGYGFGYSYSLQRSSGRNFSIGATGANYGLNLRIRRFYTDELTGHYWGHDETGSIDRSLDGYLWEDVKVKSAIFDGFYMLNGRRFSYAAAYDQSMNQIRSAGSLMLGVMWFQTSIDYAKPLNGLLIQTMGNVGKIKIQKGSIGIGYAYNWVPMRNLLLNVTAMPMLTIYNRTKLHYYESNYNLFMEEGDVSPKGQKPIPEDENDLSWTEDITLEESNTETKYEHPSFTIDARASITYQFDRFYLTVMGQLNHFDNSTSDHDLRLTDWYINAALGVRF